MTDNSVQWSKTTKSLLRDEWGQGLTEYALVIILVAIVTIVVMVLMAPQINDFINQLWLYFAL